jgi:hypothetical protein
VLGYVDAGVDPLYVLEGLRGVAVKGRLGRGGVGGEEARDWSVQPVAVEIVAGELPLCQESCDHRVAKHRDRRELGLDERA